VKPLDTTYRRVMNLAHWSTQNARRFPDRAAIVWGDRRWNWSDFDLRVSAFAAGLSALGVGRGSRVLVHSRNSHEMFESMFATFRLGAVWVPSNFRMMPDELVYMDSVAQCDVFLCQADYAGHAAGVRTARPGIRVAWLEGNVAPGDEPSAAMLVETHLGRAVADAAVEWDTPCWFLFTSGTTGRPKAAVLTHGQLACVVTNHLCDLLPDTGCDDGALVVAPLSHGAGVHQLNMVARGAKTVLLPSDKFDIDQAFELIETHQLTNLFTVPTILKMLVEHPAVDVRNHSSLRYVVYAGAPMYTEDQRLALRKLGPKLVQYYGLGEVTGTISVLPRDLHEPALYGEPQRLGTCGVERTGMQISIQDDAGRELAAQETGEICVLGPAVFAGYYDNPEANAKAFRNGWFRTGDVGHMDASGFLYLTGRASDMYISGGSNIYPRELEDRILMQGSISEVAVVGIPDRLWGEIGVAVCVRKPDSHIAEEDLLDWMASRIARYKVPKRVVFWDALPRSGYGKVPKNLVREELLRRDAGLASSVVPTN
jgi:fatty-acyl-CoA synthase